MNVAWTVRLGIQVLREKLQYTYNLDIQVEDMVNFEEGMLREEDGIDGESHRYIWRGGEG